MSSKHTKQNTCEVTPRYEKPMLKVRERFHGEQYRLHKTWNRSRAALQTGTILSGTDRFGTILLPFTFKQEPFQLPFFGLV